MNQVIDQMDHRKHRWKEEGDPQLATCQRCLCQQVAERGRNRNIVTPDKTGWLLLLKSHRDVAKIVFHSVFSQMFWFMVERLINVKLRVCLCYAEDDIRTILQFPFFWNVL